jgi:hypothetical protein
LQYKVILLAGRDVNLRPSGYDPDSGGLTDRGKPAKHLSWKRYGGAGSPLAILTSNWLETNLPHLRLGRLDELDRATLEQAQFGVVR